MAIDRCQQEQARPPAGTGLPESTDMTIRRTGYGSTAKSQADFFFFFGVGAFSSGGGAGAFFTAGFLALALPS